MPYEWQRSDQEAPVDAGAFCFDRRAGAEGDTARLVIWPHQSLTVEGFRWFIGATALLFVLPLIAVLGSPVMWILLGFFLTAVAGVWRAIMANRRHRRIREVLTLSRTTITLTHSQPGHEPLSWDANPYWVRVKLTPSGGPVENYLTLSGNDRTVELGAFLSPEERLTLRATVEEMLAKIR